MTETDGARKLIAVKRLNDSTTGLPVTGVVGSVANAPTSLQVAASGDVTMNDPDIGEEVLRRTVTL